MSDEAIRQYLDGIGHYDLLTAEEEVQLARAIEAGRKAEVALENETDPTKRRKLNHLVRAGEEARQTFTRVVEEFGSSSYRPEAERELKLLSQG